MKMYPASIYRRMGKLKRRTQIFWAGMIAGLVWFGFCLPDPLFRSPTSYVIEDAAGELLGATIAADGQWRFPYNENLPEKFKQCIISFEDRRFRYHPGIDPIAMLRAVKQNIQASRTVSGGSTITMQVIRLSRNRNRNILQKLV
ncbi:MAG TPA: transglycosylase domain-containing protein, partial [Agriterribacter sp.]|nr:transglycosylase domain-containing protein [Agriterribacter sp.]